MTTLEQLIAQNMAQTTTAPKSNKATSEDFHKFIVLDSSETVRVNSLDIFKDADGDVTIDNLKQLFTMIGWELRQKGLSGDKPKATKIDLSKLLSK